MKINLSADEFGDIVTAFILDKLLHPEDVIPYNKHFNDYAEDLRLKGMKPLSLKYYLDMDSQLRIYYKRIKNTFDKEETNKQAIIYVYPSKEAMKKNKEGIIKKAVKKLLRKENITQEERELLEEEVNNG